MYAEYVTEKVVQEYPIDANFVKQEEVNVTEYDCFENDLKVSKTPFTGMRSR